MAALFLECLYSFGFIACRELRCGNSLVLEASAVTNPSYCRVAD